MSTHKPLEVPSGGGGRGSSSYYLFSAGSGWGVIGILPQEKRRAQTDHHHVCMSPFLNVHVLIRSDRFSREHKMLKKGPSINHAR